MEQKNVVKNVAYRFERSLNKKLATKERLKTVREKISHMDDDEPMTADRRFHYPPGVPAFKPPPDAEFQEKFNSAAMGSHNIAITIPVNSTRQQALEIMYHRYQLFKLQIDAEVAESRLRSLSESTTLEWLKQEVKQPITEYDEMLSELGIEAPPGLSQRAALSEGEITKLHLAVCDKVVRNKLAEKKAAAKAVNDKQKACQELGTKPQKDLLKNAVKETVIEMYKGEGKGKGKKKKHDLDPRVDHAHAATAGSTVFMTSIREEREPKNGFAQSTTPGGQKSGRKGGSAKGAASGKGDGWFPRANEEWRKSSGKGSGWQSGGKHGGHRL